MRVTFISTYPPIECGIGYYTQFLTEALRKTPNEIHVVSQFGAKGEHTHPAYDANDNDLSKKIYEITVKHTPDLVHLQHEFGLFGEMNGVAVLDLIYRLKMSGIPVIATYHTVRPDPSAEQRVIMNAMTSALDAVVVHEAEHVDILRRLYDADERKISLIPHGARLIEPIPDAKEKLSLAGKKVILLVGYFRPTKGFDRIVELFPEILEKVPDAWLVISGKLRRANHSEYRDVLFEKINQSPAKKRIEVFRGQFPQETFDHIVCASDVMVFPYSAGAQSGVMAHAYSFGRPVVTSKLPAFVDSLQQSEAGLSAETDDDYVDAISRLLLDETLATKCSRNALAHVRGRISWEIVAGKTLEVYSKFEPGLECATRYVYMG